MRLLLLSFIIGTIAMAGAFVDLRQVYSSHSLPVLVDMLGHEEAVILIKGDSEPSIEVNNGPLAECYLLSSDAIEQGYELKVSFDPVLDDGKNGCRVSIRNNGQNTDIDLFVVIED